MIFCLQADFAAWTIGIFLDLQGHVVDFVLEHEFRAAETAVIVVFQNELVFVFLAFELKLFIFVAVHGFLPLQKQFVKNHRQCPQTLDAKSGFDPKSGLMNEENFAASLMQRVDGGRGARPTLMCEDACD